MLKEDYSDILHKTNPQKDWNFKIKHPPMSLEERAKIFHPFAAIHGHSESLEKTALKISETTQEELSEDSKKILDENLKHITDKLKDSIKPKVKIIYFMDNGDSNSGSYHKLIGIVKKLNLDLKILETDTSKISFDKIQSIEILQEN